jgi:hypothetical protein
MFDNQPDIDRSTVNVDFTREPGDLADLIVRVQLLQRDIRDANASLVGINADYELHHMYVENQIALEMLMLFLHQEQIFYGVNSIFPMRDRLPIGLLMRCWIKG